MGYALKFKNAILNKLKMAFLDVVYLTIKDHGLL